MNQNRLAAALKQIEVLVDECLREVGHKPTGGKASRELSNPTSQNALPAHILQLKGKGFFKQSKTVREVHTKLKPAYDCEPDRVAMALLRLRKRNQLRKASKKVGDKKQVAYVW